MLCSPNAPHTNCSAPHTSRQEKEGLQSKRLTASLTVHGEWQVGKEPSGEKRGREGGKDQNTGKHIRAEGGRPGGECI
eukprot:1153892-Pelagomonas_calceolata.AAC.1